MVDFKLKADRIIKERWGIEVEHIWAKDKNGNKCTYESMFYHIPKRRYEKYPADWITGFPLLKRPWCNSHLKVDCLNGLRRCSEQNIVFYIGIAKDEPKRLLRLEKDKEISPLAELGWTEADAKRWCIENNLLSPIYQTSNRSGCWFCQNQRIEELRLLRKNNPELWEIMMRWDLDSPVPFKPDGHTVHDFDKRFCMEEQGKCPLDRRFRWKMIEDLE